MESIRTEVPACILNISPKLTVRLDLKNRVSNLYLFWFLKKSGNTFSYLVNPLHSDLLLVFDWHCDANFPKYFPLDKVCQRLSSTISGKYRIFIIR